MINVVTLLEQATRGLNCAEKALKLVHKSRMADKRKTAVFIRATSDEFKDILVELINSLEEFKTVKEPPAYIRALKAIQAKERREYKEVKDTLR